MPRHMSLNLDGDRFECSECGAWFDVDTAAVTQGDLAEMRNHLAEHEREAARERGLNA